MKMTLLIGFLIGFNTTMASGYDAEKIADAIYVIEGGKKTKYPYGIKSINTHGNVAKARRICINTVNNNYQRWLKSEQTLDFLDFLANRYCPPAADAVGNQRWRINIRNQLKK